MPSKINIREEADRLLAQTGNAPHELVFKLMLATYMAAWLGGNLDRLARSLYNFCQAEKKRIRAEESAAETDRILESEHLEVSR